MMSSGEEIGDVICISPINIAVVKYWGKRDTQLVLPCNSSLSVTIDSSLIHSKIIVRYLKLETGDRFSLNGVSAALSNRLKACLVALREIARSEGLPPRLYECPVEIAGLNNFPTAAGLASSASGFAGIVMAIARLFQLSADTTTLSRIARLGSGSACRSLFGGFVEWTAGIALDGSDSSAVQVAPPSAWPDLRVVIAILSDSKKAVSSTDAMERSVKTSALLEYRTKHVVPARLAKIRDAILGRDFETFATLTMQDSNQFHAICLDTYPPIMYLTDDSHRVIDFVTQLNDFFGRSVVAYTFDAGPNAVLFTLAEFEDTLFDLLRYFFEDGGSLSQVSVAAQAVLDAVRINPSRCVKKIIRTGIGTGPFFLPNTSG